jgi:DNA-binding transcriptional ArsR family regulator
LQPQECARLLSALAAPERLRIVQMLRDGPRNVSEIAELLAIELVNASHHPSHHLTVLRHAGLVESRKKGRFVFYSLAPGTYEVDEAGQLTGQVNLGCCRLELPLPKPAEPDDQ